VLETIYILDKYFGHLIKKKKWVGVSQISLNFLNAIILSKKLKSSLTNKNNLINKNKLLIFSEFPKIL
jgi:hypothetical protein